MKPFKLTIGVILIAFLAPIITQAQTYHNTIASGSWSSASTWDANGVPNLNSNTLNITINSGHVVNAGALDFKKTSTITIKNGAHLIIGTSLTVDFDIMDVAKDFTIIVEDGGILEVNGNFNAAKDAELTITGDATFNGDVTLGQNAILTVNLPGSLDISGDLNAGNGSIMLGDGPVSVGGTVTGPAGFTADSQLPVELLSFSSIVQKNAITLTWQTASEDNNDYFTIERSGDGIHFVPQATVKGAGTSKIKLSYNYNDYSPLAGTSYYRLKQTDYNGEFEYFSMVSATFIHEDYIHISPMPASTELNVNLDGELGQVSLQLVSVTGTVVKTIPKMTNEIKMDISGLPKGMYFLTISGENSRIVKQIILQ